jgi:predicted metal-dependent hydrolase
MPVVTATLAIPEPEVMFMPPQDWRRDEGYLHAVDLYNHGYWWECHEIFEALWRAAGRQDPADGAFFQGLLQVAAACLACRGQREVPHRWFERPAAWSDSRASTGGST